MNYFLQNIRQKPETHKRGVALGLSIVLTLVIGLGWAGQRGLIFGGGSSFAQVQEEKSNQVAAVTSSLSPIENSKKTFTSGIEEIKESYKNFKDSISNVLVPFVTGIEVYERE